MSKSSRNRGPAWSCRRTAAIRDGIPSARSASFDIVRASSHSSAKTSHSGTVWTTRGATPASAAAIVLWISFPRSTARSSVSAPGIRTKNGVPSTTTR